MKFSGKLKFRKSKGRKAKKGKGRVRPKRSANAVTGGPNTCRITETYNLGLTNINSPEEFFTPGIPVNTRAASVAPNFGLYRIARITYYVKPLYDTYAPGWNGAAVPGGNILTTVPRLYWKINRYGDAPVAFDANFLRQQGSKPIRLDDKTIVISYKPNILLADAGAVAAGLNGGSGQVKMTPWLSTDDTPGNNAFALSRTVHYGHLMFIEGDAINGSSLPGVATVEAKVVWEFKNPRGTAGLTQVAPNVVQKPLLATM